MSKVCAICGKKPAFGHNRSHSMVATKREKLGHKLHHQDVRFDPDPEGA